nr:hypothetical protein BgiMline_028383 [Biomphalaria glabrata]
MIETSRRLAWPVLGVFKEVDPLANSPVTKDTEKKTRGPKEKQRENKYTKLSNGEKEENQETEKDDER